MGRTGARAARAAALAIVAVALGAGAAGPAPAAEALRLPPVELAAHRFTAEVGDVRAVFLNPAGIGVLTGNSLILSAAGYSDERDEWAVAVQGGILAAGYRHRDLPESTPGPGFLAGFFPIGTPRAGGNLDEYRLAAGVGPVWLRAGAAFVRLTSDLPGEDASSWSAGLRSRPHPAISIGGAVDHIDKPSFLDGRLGTVYTYGLALHPVPGRPEALTLSVEGAHRDGDGRVDMAYGARLLSRQGLELSLLVRDDNGEDPYLGFGATVYLGPAGAEAGFRAVNRHGDDLRWHGALQVHDGHWRRARAPRESVGS